MLYQKHPTDSSDESVRVVRFGSKSLSHYQTSYGPTKLEFLGVVTSILDCASFLRGRKFFVVRSPGIENTFPKGFERSNI